jgi:hydrogenase maturation protein HypF
LNLELPPALKDRLDASALHTVQQALAKRFNAPLTSSAGRLFDAVASLAGVRDRVEFEGQAAMQLQWLATDQLDPSPYPFEIVPGAPMQVDTRPMIRAIAQEVIEGVEGAIIAGRFHATLVGVIVEVCSRVRQIAGISKVVLSGGVFMNMLLADAVEKNLELRGFRPFRHRRVPPNDGGVSLGQIAVAAKRLTSD